MLVGDVVAASSRRVPRDRTDGVVDICHGVGQEENKETSRDRRGALGAAHPATCGRNRASFGVGHNVLHKFELPDRVFSATWVITACTRGYPARRTIEAASRRAETHRTCTNPGNRAMKGATNTLMPSLSAPHTHTYPHRNKACRDTVQRPRSAHNPVRVKLKRVSAGVVCQALHYGRLQAAYASGAR